MTLMFLRAQVVISEAGAQFPDDRVQAVQVLPQGGHLTGEIVLAVVGESLDVERRHRRHRACIARLCMTASYSWPPALDSLTCTADYVCKVPNDPERCGSGTGSERGARGQKP